MSNLRTAVIQMISSDNIQQNLDQAARQIDAACRDGASFILLPENFAYMGVEEQDKLTVAEPFGAGKIQQFLANQSLSHGIWICAGTIPLTSLQADKIAPASVIYDPDGQVYARYDKIHLFDVCADGDQETYQESSTFAAGDEVVVCQTPFANIGLSVCYDLRFPELYRQMHEHDVNLITAPSAFTYTTGEQHWECLVRSRAIENLSYVMAANQGGMHANQRQTWGHSMIVSPWGKVLAEVESGVGFAAADLDMLALQQLRQQFPALDHRKF